MSSADLVTAEAPGVRITACNRGAHLMTWTTHGVERLWMSPLSGCGGASAIRGGVPVLFPQFGTFGPLAKHGFARTAQWTPLPVTSTAQSAELSFELTDTPETRAVWPHEFHARLAIEASADTVAMALTVTNVGAETAHFTGGLHTYLAVADPQATISGLAGCRCWDGASTQSPHFTEPIEGPIRALDTQDRVMTGPAAQVVLHDAARGSVRITAEGFANRIVWNPGAGHGLPDVAPGDEAHFVCIEPAVVEPVALAAGGTWAGRMTLSLSQS
ncbi:MAG: hypothetical protein WCF36_04550 [Candidatus Nanopelagicales bacterium]